MTIQLLITFTTDFLENKNLLSLCVILEYSSFNYSTFYVRSTDLNCSLVIDEKNLVELYRLVFLRSKAVNKNL